MESLSKSESREWLEKDWSHAAYKGPPLWDTPQDPISDLNLTIQYLFRNYLDTSVAVEFGYPSWATVKPANCVCSIIAEVRAVLSIKNLKRERCSQERHLSTTSNERRRVFARAFIMHSKEYHIKSAPISVKTRSNLMEKLSALDFEAEDASVYVYSVVGDGRGRKRQAKRKIYHHILNEFRYWMFLGMRSIAALRGLPNIKFPDSMDGVLLIHHMIQKAPCSSEDCSGCTVLKPETFMLTNEELVLVQRMIHEYRHIYRTHYAETNNSLPRSCGSTNNREASDATVQDYRSLLLSEDHGIRGSPSPIGGSPRGLLNPSTRMFQGDEGAFGERDLERGTFGDIGDRERNAFDERGDLERGTFGDDFLKGLFKSVDTYDPYPSQDGEKNVPSVLTGHHPVDPVNYYNVLDHVMDEAVLGYMNSLNQIPVHTFRNPKYDNNFTDNSYKDEQLGSRGSAHYCDIQWPPLTNVRLPSCEPSLYLTYEESYNGKPYKGEVYNGESYNSDVYNGESYTGDTYDTYHQKCTTQYGDATVLDHHGSQGDTNDHPRRMSIPTDIIDYDIRRCKAHNLSNSSHVALHGSSLITSTPGWSGWSQHMI